MPIKPEIREICRHCGEINARMDGDYIIETGHQCKFASPGPPDFPRRHHRSKVIFLTRDGKAVHHRAHDPQKSIAEDRLCSSQGGGVRCQ